jgi:hypothetical protein
MVNFQSAPSSVELDLTDVLTIEKVTKCFVRTNHCRFLQTDMRVVNSILTFSPE